MVLFASIFITLLLEVTYALDLPKARTRNRTIEVAQGACKAELESDNVKLRSKL
jgi:hypothetical protein